MMPQIEHNGPNFFYRVHFRNASSPPSSPWTSVDVTDWTREELVVRNQPSATRYLIRVEAHNQLGESYIAAESVTGYSG